MYQFSFLLVVVTASAAVERPDSTTVICKNQKIVRTIQVNAEDHQCSTVYTKAGVDRTVGSARSRESCLKYLKNIQDNLEKADWKCRDVSQKISENVP